MNIKLLTYALLLAGMSGLAHADDSDCRQCHSNPERLLERLDTDSLADASLTTGQRLQQLQIDLDKMGSHGTIACQDCHTETTSTDDAWHPAILTRPSEDGGTVCAGCHGDALVERFQHSLHFTVNGIARGLVSRLAQTPDAQAQFDAMHNGEEGCSSCHASCGSCHVNQPEFAGGGLADGHAFAKTPDPEKTCHTCHYENAEIHLEVDVHAKAGLSCLDCHQDETEFHGQPLDSVAKDTLWSNGPAHLTQGHYAQTQKRDTVKARCVDCHADKAEDHTSLLTGKPALINHNDKLDCISCHTQPYATCYGCHSGEEVDSIGGWTPGMEKMTVVIGLKEANNPDSLLTTLSHSPGPDRDSGIVVDPTHPDTKSFFVPFAAHFTARNPLVTDEANASGRMCENCHNTQNSLLLEASELGPRDPVADRAFAVPAERLPKH